MNRYIYYLTQRPPDVGAFPRGISELFDYGQRLYIPDIGREAYAEVTYPAPLTPQQVADYELTPAPR